MRVLSRLFIGTALGLAATQALALTGEEVWANQTGYLSGLGVRISQTQSREGSVLTVSDISYDIALPFGLGSLSARSGPQTYTENVDGTVNIGYGDTNTVAIAGSFRSDDLTEFNLAANLQIVLAGNTTVASGTAADVTYVSSTDRLEMTLTDLSISGAPDVQDLAVDVYVSVADTDSTVQISTVQITTGGRTTIRSTSSTGLTIVD